MNDTPQHTNKEKYSVVHVGKVKFTGPQVLLKYIGKTHTCRTKYTLNVWCIHTHTCTRSLSLSYTNTQSHTHTMANGWEQKHVKLTSFGADVPQVSAVEVLGQLDHCLPVCAHRDTCHVKLPRHHSDPLPHEHSLPFCMYPQVKSYRHSWSHRTALSELIDMWAVTHPCLELKPIRFRQTKDSTHA